MTDIAATMPLPWLFQRYKRLSPKQRAIVDERIKQGALLTRLGIERFPAYPRPGYWLIRLVKKAVEVPATIQYEVTEHEPGEVSNRMERSPILTARINGEIVPLSKVWNASRRTITDAEYRYRLALTDYAMQHAPGMAQADPTQPIDFLKVELPF